MIDSLNNMKKVNDTLALANDCMANITDLTDRITSSVNTWVDLQRDIHLMDVQFNAYVATLDNNLEKYKISAPIVQAQLDNLNKMMDRILDKVLGMDAELEKEMDFKMKLMESLDSYTDKLATMMVKLL